MAGLHVQSIQHIHRRCLCLHYYNADRAPRRLLPRRHRFPDLSVPAMALPSRQVEDRCWLQHGRRRRVRGRGATVESQRQVQEDAVITSFVVSVDITRIYIRL